MSTPLGHCTVADFGFFNPTAEDRALIAAAIACVREHADQFKRAGVDLDRQYTSAALVNAQEVELRNFLKVHRRGRYRADRGRRKDLWADLKHRLDERYSLAERFNRAYCETFNDETAFSVMRGPDKRIRALRMVLLAATNWDADRATAPHLTEFQGLGHCVTVDGRPTWSACERPDFKEILIVHKRGWLWNYDHKVIAKVREALAILDHDPAFASAKPPATPHAAAINIISIASMSNSIIAQTGAGAVQQVRVDGVDLQQVREILDQIKGQLGDLQLSADRLQELNAHVSRIEAQLASPTPGRIIIREGLKSARNILEGAVAGVVALPLIAGINAISGG